MKNISLKKVDQTLFNIGKFYLEPNDILFRETIIEGEKPEMIIKNDTIEYNVSSYKVSKDAVWGDLLKKLLDVEVSKDGKITVNGKEVRIFLIDDKEFFLDDPRVAAKKLPVKMIEKLQVIDRKSDQTSDDREAETIINLSKSTIGDVSFGVGGEGRTYCQVDAFVRQMKNKNLYTIIFGQNNDNNNNNNNIVSLNKEFSSVFSLSSNIYYNNNLEDIETKEIKLLPKLQLSDNTHIQKDSIFNAIADFRLEYKPNCE